jgi:hypothetical protein
MGTINFDFLALSLLNILIIWAWLALAAFALLALRKRGLSRSATVIWALVILLLPVVGAVSFFIVKPE